MKTLIVYATKYGSVEKCANILKEKLNGDVEVANVRAGNLPDIGDFENLVIGGSIYIGKIQREIRDFCVQHLESLLTKKVGVFICAGEEPEKSYAELKEAFPAKLYEHAAVKEIFGHEVYYEKLSWVDKLALRVAKGVKESSSKLLHDNIEKVANAMNG